ncbi:hypothetical protein V8D89_005656 [Ganoderma adspersum]
MSDRIGWVLLHPDLRNYIHIRTQNIPYAETYIELYRSFVKMAIYHNKVVNYIQESTVQDGDKAQALASAQAAYDECIIAAMKLMNKTLSTRRWAHALWDILPYRNQHNGNAIWQLLPDPARLSTVTIAEMVRQLDQEMMDDEDRMNSPTFSTKRDWEVYVAELLAQHSNSSDSDDSSPSSSSSSSPSSSSDDECPSSYSWSSLDSEEFN